jgi:two-component system, sensor histidine kinase SagS
MPKPADLPTPMSLTASVGQRLRRQLLLATAAVLLLAWAGVGALLVQKRQDAIDAEIRQNTNIVRAFEEQTLRVLAAVDQATLRLHDAVVAADEVNPVKLDLVRFANETGLAPNILVQLSLVDASGRFLGSNLDPDGLRTGRVDLSAREHIQAHLRPDALPAEMRPVMRDALFIGKPVLGKVSKKWTIQLSRRIAGHEGALKGVIVASVDPSYFEGVYKRVSLGQRGSLTLVGTDTVMRARVLGGQSQGMGTAVSRNGPFATYAAHPEGHLLSRSTVDAVDRIYAYRRVADYPLILIAATAQDEALAEWQGQRNLALVLMSLLTAAVAAGAAAVALSLRRIEQTLEALRASEAKANAANQAKSEFLAAVSHELRTPLTSIRGFSELMESHLDDPKFRRAAALVRKGAEHLNELLSEILDLAKVEAGAMSLFPEPVDLRALLQGTADFFAMSAADKGLAMHLTVADDLPPTLACDRLRLKQILNNLLSNAIKFTPQGAVAIEAERRGDDVAIHVVDTGPGIPETLHETVFERFSQADGRVSYEHGGTGLGLALARGLAERMKGRLDLQSAPGQGARFTLTLPLVVAAS